MDREYIDRNHIVARYLADQLTDDEREAFEAYYMEHPEMVREMEATARFKSALATLADRGELSTLIHSHPTRRPWQWAALAATVAAIAIGVSYVVRTPTPRSQMVAHMEALQLPIGRMVRIERTRGLTDAEFELPAAGTAIGLQIVADFEASPAEYRVSLLREAQDAPGAIAKLERVAANDGIVTVYLDRAVVQPGVYRLSIEGAKGTDAEDQRSDFRIRLR
ncbi:hypothetical protein JM946_00775 [Steroidobacter sp. S1-65]|uniref:Anti-sigma factor n=1 Tax=Steroidobacter gossypii TaxID=2805490 RepID=A0ABS1WQL2_9GAMM|nr:hypothetical protein [Steroidobacter gossypii]MBM0103250.1 hypothetical protein [Steroidobacter gossypii]